MKDSSLKICCPHCKYKTPVVRTFINGVVRNGVKSMIVHIKNSHDYKGQKYPRFIIMSPEQEEAELHEWIVEGFLKDNERP